MCRFNLSDTESSVIVVIIDGQLVNFHVILCIYCAVFDSLKILRDKNFLFIINIKMTGIKPLQYAQFLDIAY